MKSFIKLFTIIACFASVDFFSANAATCSNANLIKCLDSACSVNIGLNPASRCQLCGTSAAGSADTNSGMKSLSVGASSKNTLSNTELKSAPKDPGKRYAWATEECIKKVSGCTVDDVSNAYDNLIEQSCKAAGINAEMNSLMSAAKKTKTATACNSEILLCLTDTKKCNSDFSNCKTDADFNKFFSACSAQASGCDDSISTVRSNMLTERDSAVTGSENIVANIVKAYQSRRENGLESAKNSCENNNARDNCVKTVCQNNMPNKCAVGYESEKSMAILLCKFYDTACDRLK